MRKLFLMLVSVATALSGYAQCNELFFSEYLEGSSNNKALEIFNASSDTVNLADYKIMRYNNGSAIPTDSLHMVGQLLPGAVFVAGNPTAVATILAVSDTLHTITFFNGDDALSLVNKTTNTVLDIIGIIGVDPGTNWPVGTGATSEFTLVRMPGIHQGNLDWSVSATEWIVYAQNTDTTLGAHTMTACCTGAPTIDALGTLPVLCHNGTGGAVFSVSGGVAPYTYSLGNIASGAVSDTLWASTVIAFSSEYSTGAWSAAQVLGAPNTYPNYGDIATAWTTYADQQRQFIVVGYAAPVVATNVLVYETYRPGAIDTVYVREAANNTWVTIYTGTATAGPNAAVIQNYPIPGTVGAIDAVRIAVNEPAVSSYNEYDAIGIATNTGASVSNIPAGTYTLTITGANGCFTDTSLVYTNPAIIATSQSISICSDQYIYVGNIYHDTTGVYVDTIPSMNGCDSIVTTTLTVNPGVSTTFSQDLKLCAGSSYTIGNHVYTTDGEYIDTLDNVAGCDSIVYTNLSFYSTNVPTVTVTELANVNIAFGGTASASDEYTSYTQAFQAFDGNIDTSGWGNAGDSLPSWLMYDFGPGNAKVVEGYAIYCSSNMDGGWDWEGYDPGAWMFQGFNGTDWDTLDTRVDSFPTQDVWDYYSFPNTTPYEKYRIYITGSEDGDYAMITELQLLKKPLCADKVFVASINDVAAPATFQWSVNGTPVSGATGDTLNLPAFQIGDSISCVIVTSNTCATTQSVSSYTTTIEGPANAAITTDDFGLTITASAKGAAYQWITCPANTPIAGATDRSFTPTANGSYAVIVTAGTCSVDTSACVAVTSVGIDAANMAQVSVFPNPNNGMFMIRSSADGSFTLMNALGQTVETIELNAANNREAVLTLQQAAGVYFLKGNDGMLYSKVVINP